MKILMVSLDYPPTVGGIAAHVYELSKALQQLGHTVSVVTRKLPSHRCNSKVSDSITIYRLQLRGVAPIYGWQINRFISKKLAEIKPDIIHIHGMAPLEGYRIKSYPLVYTNHTSGYLKRIQKGGLRRMFMLKRLFNKPDLFLAPSRELLHIPFPIGAPKKFIPNGIDVEKYRFDPEARIRVRMRLGLSEDDLVGILSRRLVSKNGVIYLAKAACHIESPRLKLIVIGDGEEKSRIERILHSQFENRFFMLGAKQHDEIIEYYSAADFSILPSLMEATSISGLEAMAASLPLVGTSVGGIPELINNGHNGYLCRSADERDLARKIDMLLAVDLKIWGRRSRQMVEEKFAWPWIAQQTLSAYKDLL